MSFKVQRGYVDTDGDGVDNNAPQYVTLTAGVDYDTPDPTHAFFRLTNTRHGGYGRVGENNVLEWIRAFMLWVSDPTQLDKSIQVARAGDATIGRLFRSTWEIVEYTGPAGGPDEFVVRQQAVLTCADTASSVDGAAVGVGSVARCAVIITGQSGDIRIDSGMARCQFTAELVDNGDGTVTPRFTRGSSTDDAFVSYALIEFKGANWRDVQRIESSTVVSVTQILNESSLNRGDDVSIPTAILDPGRAFLIDSQYRTDNDPCGLDDLDAMYLVSGLHPTTLPGATNASYLRRSGIVTAGTRVCVGWLVESLNQELEVTHVAAFINAGGGYTEPHIVSYPLGFDAAVLERTMLTGWALTCDGSGVAFPRGANNLLLTDVGHVEIARNDHGQEEFLYFSVVNFPPTAAAAAAEDLGPPPETEAVLTSPVFYEAALTGGDHEAVVTDPVDYEAELL